MAAEAGNGDAHGIVDYLLDERRTFDELPLRDADLLACASLAYLEFKAMPGLGALCPRTLAEVASMPQSSTLTNRIYAGKTMAQMLEAVGRSPRFGSMRLVSFEAVLDPVHVMQYGACALQLDCDPPTTVLAFRGTGTELVGWHEDFNLAITEAVPSQLAAAVFLAKMAAERPDDRFVLVGHSKGGALAEFAALSADRGTARRIDRVVAFDAPGLFGMSSDACPEFAAFDADLLARYDAAPFPMTRYVFPAMVGLMLDPRPLETMRYCAHVPGTFGHDVTAARIENGEFVLCVPSTGELVRGTALNRWVERLTLLDRQCFIDAVFGECRRRGVCIDFSQIRHVWDWMRFIIWHYARGRAGERRQLRRVIALAAREFLFR